LYGTTVRLNDTRFGPKKKLSPIYLGPKNLDTFWCTGWVWNCQIIFRFASIHGRACFILIIMKNWGRAGLKSSWKLMLYCYKMYRLYRHGMCFRASSVFVLSILCWFPQRTHYFWRVFRFLFMEHKQDYSVTSVKDVKVCF
jgi:hypothetical protein